MAAKFLDDNNRVSAKAMANSKKTKGLDWQKNNFVCASHFSVHFLAVVARLRHKTSYFHRPALWGRWTRQKVSFSFSKLRNGTFGFNPENFANIWQIKWHWIRSKKFDTVRLYLLSEFSVCCHPKTLLPRQHDLMTSLYYGDSRMFGVNFPF